MRTVDHAGYAALCRDGETPPALVPGDSVVFDDDRQLYVLYLGADRYRVSTIIEAQDADRRAVEEQLRLRADAERRHREELRVEVQALLASADPVEQLVDLILDSEEAADW